VSVEEKKSGDLKRKSLTLFFFSSLESKDIKSRQFFYSLKKCTVTTIHLGAWVSAMRMTEARRPKIAARPTAQAFATVSTAPREMRSGRRAWRDFMVP
jgi:hypothetical protein